MSLEMVLFLMLTPGQGVVGAKVRAQLATPVLLGMPFSEMPDHFISAERRQEQRLRKENEGEAETEFFFY